MRTSIDQPNIFELPPPSLQDLRELGRAAPMLDQYDRNQLSADMRAIYDRATGLMNRMLSMDTDELAAQIVDSIDHDEIESLDDAGFDLYSAIGILLRRKSGEDEYGYIGLSQQKVRKDFALGVITHVKELIEGRSSEVSERDSRVVSKLDRTLFSGSPNSMDYVGGLDDQIDIALAAQEVPELRRAVWEVRESVMQGITFSKEPEMIKAMLVEKVAGAPPVRQLELLKFYDALSHQATDASYGEDAARVLTEVYSKVAASNNALTGIIAEQYRLDTLQRSYDDISLTGDAAASLTRHEEFGLKNHIQLPEGWQGLYRPAHVAVDTIGLRDNYGIIRQVAHVEGIPENISAQEMYLSNVRDVLSQSGNATYPDEFYYEAKQFLETRLDQDGALQIRQTRDLAELIATVDRLLRPYEEPVIHMKKTEFDSMQTVGAFSDEAVNLLQNVHIPAIREALEASTGVRLSQISLATQAQLLEYMVRRTPEEFRRLSRAAEGIQGVEGSTSQFYEAFLATEFGDDFGEKILSIAEHAPAEQSARIFEIINNYRKESASFAKIYQAYDPELAQATEQAMNERLSDMLAIAEHVARDGKITVDTAPHREEPDYVHDGRFDLSVKTVGQVINTMEHLHHALAQRRRIVDNPHTKVTRVIANSNEVGYQIYRFHLPQDDSSFRAGDPRSALRDASGGDVLLHVRSEGASVYDKAFEYGNYDGVEATISWVVNPTGDHKLASDKDPDGVSIRFDREGRRAGEAPNSSERTPIRDDGVISLDISSGLGNAKSVPVQIGRMLAAGNILRAKEQGMAASLHHNTNYFDQTKYGTSDGFASLARYITASAEARIKMSAAKKIGKREVDKLFGLRA